jgi:hypothetical protein
MAENGTGSFLVILLCVVMIVGGLFNIMTSNVIKFESQATVYPPVRVLYSEFSGGTTNFSSFDETGLRIITNLTLESPGVGKVVFDGVTDLTADKDEYNVIDINGYAQFSANSLYIDTGNLTSLRKSASVFMYGLGFTDPIVLVDGYSCPPTICQVIDYSGGTLVFRVTQFSRYYSAQETPSGEAPGPSGGAAYPSRPVPFSNFSLSKEFIKVVLKQGETLLDSVVIKNTGDMPLDFNLSVAGIPDKVALSEDVFSLAPGKEKTITVAFTVMENGHADVYAGKILVTAGGIRKTVLLVMEVKERSALFDVYLDLGAVPFDASPGTDVEADILLYNFGDLRPVDVTLYYSLRDFDGNEILYKHDTIAVEEQKDVKRMIRLPEDLKDGMYLFYARVEYGNQTASSSGIINVARGKAAVMGTTGWEIVVAAAAVVLAAALFMALRRSRFMRRIRLGYGSLGGLRASGRLRTARIRREKAEKAAGERRLERLEAEVAADNQRMKREAFQDRMDFRKVWKRKRSRRS